VGRRLIIAITLLCFGGCASTATIQRTDGPDSEALIVSSDPGAVYVRARNTQTYRIGRESISGIDHPGNVEIVAGAILIGLGAALAVSVYQDTGERAAIPFVFGIYGGPGLGMAISGTIRYLASLRAAEAFESVNPPLPPVSPVPLPGAYPPVPVPPPPATEPAPAQPPAPPPPSPDGEAPTVTPGPT
jgi:hypothetical protein